MNLLNSRFNSSITDFKLKESIALMNQCVGGIEIDIYGVVRVPMFAVSFSSVPENTLVLFTLLFSFCCNLKSILSLQTMLKNNYSLKSIMDSHHWILGCIFIWQCTNTYILGYLISFGITRSLLALFILHTYLEWIISLFYEYHYYSKHIEVSFYDFILSRPHFIFIIGLVGSFCSMHFYQILFNGDLPYTIWIGQFGYLLDTVGFVSSLRFCYKMGNKLSLYCLGSFGGHFLAIIGTFIACLVGMDVYIVLMLASCIQNGSSTLVVNHLTKIIKLKTN